MNSKISPRTGAFRIAAIVLFGLACRVAAAEAPAPTQIQAVRPSPSAPLTEILFTRELTIGVVEGDENYMFGKSVGLSVDGRGNIYVLDWDKKHIKKYGPDGKYLLTIGRPGQGPGEFRNPSTARFTSDGNIYVSENFGNRLHNFDPEGKFLGQTTLPDKIFNIRIGPTGVRLGIRHKSPQYVGQGPTEATTTIFDDQYRPLVELHKDVIDVNPSRDGSLAQRLAEIATYFLARPNATAVMGEDGRIYFGCNDAYAIDVYAPDGKKLRTVARDVRPAPYEAEDIEFVLKTYAENSYADQPEAVRNEILKLIRFPKNKPVFRTVVPMENGMFSVVADLAANDECLLDVFDGEGNFRGRVRIKVPLNGLHFKNGKAYSVAQDEDGYSFVERYAYEIR